MQYPSRDDEIEIIRRTRQVDDGRLDTLIEPITEPSNILAMRKQLSDIHVEPVIEAYVVDLVAATRDIDKHIPDWSRMITAGASPRGAISLLKAASTNALLHQRDYVIPEDVIALAADVLRHRIVLDFAAQAEGIDADRIITELIQRVPAP
jgi:MoxR-like ATPase